VNTVPLNCNHCGAPLSVPETARFVTCSHCHAQLAIHHEGAAVFTEMLGEIAERTANIEEHLDELRLEKDLERVDAAWEQERREIMVGGENGPPKRSVIWLFSLVCAAVGAHLVWRMTQGRRGISPWFLLIPPTVAWLFGWIMTMQVDRYEESESFYRRIRNSILRRGRPKRYARTGADLTSSPRHS